MSIPVPSTLELIALCGTMTSITCGAFVLRYRAMRHVPEDESMKYYNSILQDFILYLACGCIALALMVVGFGLTDFGDRNTLLSIGRIGLGVFVGVNMLACLNTYERTAKERDPVRA